MILTPLEQMLQIRRGGQVVRWHTEGHISRKPTVAEHSHGVAMLLLYIVPGHDLTVRLLTAALCHDLGEFATGDMPATTKWALREGRLRLEKLEERYRVALGVGQDLSVYQQQLLRAADFLDLCFFVLEQYLQGNVASLVHMKRLQTYHEKSEVSFVTPRSKELYGELQTMFIAARSGQTNVLYRLAEIDIWEHLEAMGVSRIPGLSEPGSTTP